jgi:hypothetical protein
MRAHTATPVPPVAQLLGQPERWHGNRTPALFSLLYSGMNTGQMLIGDGVVTNLSRGGSAFAESDRSYPAWTWPSLSTFPE